jgi:DNA polymerase III subunit epsilon
LDIRALGPYNNRPMNSFDLAIVDVETTGTSPGYDRVIEVGVLRIKEGKVVETYSTLVDPERSIPFHIENLTGITSKDLSGAPTFGDIKDQLMQLLEGCVFVAHNARFDYGFLRHEFGREGIDFSARCLCTARLSRKLFPHERRHGLDSIIQRYGIACQNRHRALDDAQVLWNFLDLLKDRVDAPRLMAAVQELLKTSTLPPHIEQSMIKSLPDSTGVYVFYGGDGSPLYVGESANIRNDVLSHFSNVYKSSREMSLCQQVRDIKAIKTAGELGALLLESHLIRDLYPLYNRRSLASRKLLMAKRVLTDNGYFSAKVDSLNILPPSDLPDILGIFRTKRKAKEFLLTHTREHGLCPKLMGLEKGNVPCSSVESDICHGACTGEESPRLYNDRFMRAFAASGIKAWPFSGPILVEEKNGSVEGEAFLIDQWCIVGSFRFDDTGTERFLPAHYVFDYDRYKILTQFLLGPKTHARLRPITYDEFHSLLEKFNAA